MLGVAHHQQIKGFGRQLPLAIAIIAIRQLIEHLPRHGVVQASQEIADLSRQLRTLQWIGFASFQQSIDIPLLLRRTM